MSLNTIFNTYNDVLNFLSKRDNPTCFKVNYLPDSNKYNLWIGNQPYESYEEIIDDVYNQLNKTREKNKQLEQVNQKHIEVVTKQSDKINELREKVLHYSKTILQTVEHLENIKTPEDSYEDIHIGLICWLDGVLEGKW